MPDKEFLRGWKDIEAFLGMSRKTIIRCGYPIRKEGDETEAKASVFALRSELLCHAKRREEKDPL